MRWKPGGIIDCDEPEAMKALFFDKEFITSLKAENMFVNMVSSRTPFSYTKPAPKGWSTYQWVGFWNYAVLGTTTVLAFWLLHLGGLI